MPSASMAETAIAPDLKCSGCGNPIIKDGQFKCLRCKPHRLVLATLDRNDIACPRHEKPVVLMRYDRKNDQHRAYCQKRGCPNYKAKTGTLMPFEVGNMSQEIVAEDKSFDSVHDKSKSKTQELRDWLDGEIERNREGCITLEVVLRIETDGSPYRLYVSNDHAHQAYRARYGGLTPDEREVKVAEDHTKLEELQKRLELLRSARELDVDIDALESAGVEVSRMASHEAIFEGRYRIGDGNCTFRIDAGRRHFTARFSSSSVGIFSCAYESVVVFKVGRGGRNPHYRKGLALALPSNYDWLIIH